VHACGDGLLVEAFELVVCGADGSISGFILEEDFDVLVIVEGCSNLQHSLIGESSGACDLRLLFLFLFGDCDRPKFFRLSFIRGDCIFVCEAFVNTVRLSFVGFVGV